MVEKSKNFQREAYLTRLHEDVYGRNYESKPTNHPVPPLQTQIELGIYEQRERPIHILTYTVVIFMCIHSLRLHPIPLRRNNTPRVLQNRSTSTIIVNIINVIVVVPTFTVINRLLIIQLPTVRDRIERKTGRMYISYIWTRRIRQTCIFGLTESTTTTLVVVDQVWLTPDTPRAKI